MSEILQHHYGLVDRNPEYGFNACLLNAGEIDKVDAALKLEHTIWDAKKYGSLDTYEKYLQQSRIFAAFGMDADCLGVARVFEGWPEQPPFLELPIDDDVIREKLVDGCLAGTVEELGTVAVADQAPLAKVALGLWRLAYRDAESRRIKTWGIIMEPRRVNVMNRHYGFTFKQIGPTVEYQGGACAAHVMDLEEASLSMSRSNPGYYQWFVNEPLNI